MYFPDPSEPGSTWPPDFPCCAVEWASGANISESPVFSEITGLDICAQILDLLAAARQAAPDVILTDSLKPSNIIIAYDERGAITARMIDWNVYATNDPDAHKTMLARLGQLMADIFADWRGVTDADSLGAGRPGDPTLSAWDALSWGTRTLVRRALRGGFDGDADTVIGELRQLIAEQRARWADNDPLWQARLAEGGFARLNWLDMAVVKQGGLSDEARARLTDSLKSEMAAVVDEHMAGRKHADAVLDLRVAARRHPDESYFRWALLANTAATLGPDGAFQRLQLGEALALMRGGQYAQARRAWDHGVTFFDEAQFDPAKRERARDCVLALSMCAQSLALSESGSAAIHESWNLEEAESTLALAEDRANRHERLAANVLHGPDPLCAQKIAALRQSIADFYGKHGRRDPYAARRETTEQARRANFARLVERGRALAAAEKPDGWSTALSLFDRAASEYPDLWKEDGDRERGALVEMMSRRKLEEGKRSLADGDWVGAGSALAAAMLWPATSGEAARLQSALWAYQRGEIELSRGDSSAALSSFMFAAAQSAEIRSAAGLRIQLAKEKGEPPGDDALTRELIRRFAEQQESLKSVVQGAALLAQEQAHAKQMAALRQAREEERARQAEALRQSREEQSASVESALEKFQNDFASRLEAASKKLQEDQTARLRAELIRMYDEHAEGQRESLKEAQKELAAGLNNLQAAPPEWFVKAQIEQRKSQEAQEAKVQAALKSLEDLAAWLRASVVRQETPAKQAAPVNGSSEAAVKELEFKLEKNTTALKSVSGRLGGLMALNVALALIVLLIIGGAGAYLYFGSRLGLPTIASAPVSTDAVAEPTVAQPAAVSPPSSNVTLACADADQVRSFYDCTVTNTTDQPQSFTLRINAGGKQTNGFFYAVQLGDTTVTPLREPSLPAGSAMFPIGNYIPGESKPVRINLSCTSAGGCKSTAFTFTVAFANDSSDPVPGDEVSVITFYSPP